MKSWISRYRINTSRLFLFQKVLICEYRRWEIERETSQKFTGNNSTGSQCETFWKHSTKTFSEKSILQLLLRLSIKRQSKVAKVTMAIGKGIVWTMPSPEFISGPRLKSILGLLSLRAKVL
jgi:hypothetical protein